MNIHKPLFFAMVPILLVTAANFPGLVSARTPLYYSNLRTTSSATATGAGRLTPSPATIGIKTTNADKEITRRLTALANLATRITNMKNISPTQQAGFQSEIQTAITQLTDLKTKIDADTDPTILKADKQSIVTDYRVFLLLLPKIEILSHADLALQLDSQMTANNATIQAKITAEQTAGKDVSALNALMADRVTKLAAATTELQNVIAEATPLTPAGYPDNRAVLTSNRNVLQLTRENLRGAYQDLVQMNQIFGGLK